MDQIPVRSNGPDSGVASRPASIDVAAQKVLRNTYLLLSMTLLWSAGCAGAAMAMGAPLLNPWLMIIVYFGLLYGVRATQNSGWGVLMVFALTGFLGYTIGPILSLYVRAIPDGGSVVMTALGLTGTTFLGLSAYALLSRKDFSFMRSFLVVGIWAAFGLSLVSLFFHLSGLSLVVSAMFVFLSSGIILWKTGEIVNGGERNYISATVTLYVQIFNLFMSLLNILGGSRR